MANESLKYLDDPQKYCEKINSLLAQNSKEWIKVWKAAIPEMSSVQCKEISKINALLKPVEAAFKSKDSNLRVQAFECWSYFIANCEMLKESDKLLNVVLIPLLAHNHSVYIVLSAKLKTWHVLVDTPYITKESIMKKAVPSLLRCMYGPHSSELACNFAALSETCGQLYHKVLTKCAPFSEPLDYILSYLEKAIPPLSNMENAQKVAKLIWSDALSYISGKEWPKNFFTYLMRTFENLISDEKNDGFQLISNFQSILVNIYGSFSRDRLTPYINLMIRCLFHPPININTVTNNMNGLLKLCEDPLFFFQQSDVVLISIAEGNKNDIDKLWMAVAACYKKWLRNNSVNDSKPPNHSYTTACKILLFPLSHLSNLGDDSEKFNSIMKQWKSCYEECASSADAQCDKFLKSLAEGMEIGIESTFKKDMQMRISAIKVAISFCNAILTLMKFSEGFPHLKSVLHKISENIPHVKKLSEYNLKSFAAKYVVTVLSYVKLFPNYSNDFSDVIKTFGPLVSNEMDQIILKVNTAKVDDDDSIETVSNTASIAAKTGNITTPAGKLKIRSSFLERLSPANKKSDVVDSLVRPQTTPKHSRISDDDVEFIAIAPKPKNSPMTEHQREMAKTKSHIPTIYQDLSQQSQSDSISLLSSNKKPNEEIQSDLFEENANLPAADMCSDKVDMVPGTLSFRSGLDALKSDKGTTLFSSKKSLFNEARNTSNEETRPRSTVEHNNENLPPIEEIATVDDDKQPVKRRQSKAPDVPVTPKRSKRLTSKAESPMTMRSGRQTTPLKADAIKKRRSVKPNDTPSGKEETEKNVEVINLTDSESQNVFVPTSASKRDKIVNVSSPLNSLMNVKNDDPGSKTRRKSLRTRKHSLPSRSPISTRKRASIADGNVSNRNKCLFPDDSTDDGKNESNDDDRGKDADPKDIISEVPVDEPVAVKKLKLAQVDGKEANSVEKTNSHEVMETDDDGTNEPERDNVEKSNVADAAVTSDSSSEKSALTCIPVDDKPTSKSPIDDSVILIEENNREVISIDDSNCCEMVEKEKASVKHASTIPRTKMPLKQEVSDESTFFESSDEASKNTSKDKCNDKEKDNEKIVAQESPKSVPTNVIRSTNDETNSIENANPPVSPEIVKSIDTPDNDTDANDVPSANDRVEPTATETDKTDDATSSVSILENASTSASNESVSILDTSSSVQKANEEKTVDESPIVSVENEEQNPISISDDDKNGNSPEKSEEKESAGNPSVIVDKDEMMDKSSGDTSPRHGNSRASQMVKLASGKSPNQTIRYSKPGKPRLSNGGTMSQYLKTPSQRSSRIMKSVNFDNDHNLNTTPNKIITTPIAEKLKYTPKECTSPGILKKPDANQNTSPKSPKIVNFADKLTDTREFYVDDGIDMDSLISTGDKLSNNHLIDCEDVQSQDVLYSPLQNCRDDIKNIIEYIFSSSWNQQALEHFQRIGINTVGQLASMSTLSASSIPAGDNRIQRLKNALKKYDEKISSLYESKGLRRPSVRRRISKAFECENMKRLEVSSIIDLLKEDDSDEDDNSAEEEKKTETPSTEVEEISQHVQVEAKLTSPKKTPVTVANNETEVTEKAKTADTQSNIILQLSDTNDKEVSVVLSRLTVAEIKARSVEDVALEKNDVNETESVECEENVETKSVECEENVETKTVEREENIETKTVDDENANDSAEIVESAVNECEQSEPEPMDVDEESPNDAAKANDAANDSTDYVCTSNDHENDTNATTEKRNLTIRNIRRYSTVFESQHSDNVVPVADKSPEIVTIDEDDETADQSVSIFAQEEGHPKEAPIESQPTSPSVISGGDFANSDVVEVASVAEQPTSGGDEQKTTPDGDCSVDEIPATIDQAASPCPVRDELVSDPVPASTPRDIYKKCLSVVTPHYDGSEEQARDRFFNIIEEFNKILETKKERLIHQFKI